MGDVRMCVEGREPESWTEVMPRLTRLITDLEAVSGVRCTIDVALTVQMSPAPTDAAPAEEVFAQAVTELSHDRAIRLLRAKAGELEATVQYGPVSNFEPHYLAADIALVATLLADQIERSHV